MKKSFLSALLVVLSAFVFAITAGASDMLCGDANGDGIVDGKDVTRLQKYIQTYNSETQQSGVSINGKADVNGDGIINNDDKALLLTALSYHDENNTDIPVVKFGYYVINGNIYYFNDDASMHKGGVKNGYTFNSNGVLVGNNIFVTAGENTYYICDNKIVTGYKVISNSVYYFGENGVMRKNVAENGYVFDADGRVTGDSVFIVIEGNTYCVINNTIAKNYQVINDSIYYFGTNGVMRTDEKVNGNRFGTDGKLIGNNIFITINNNKYYVVNNVIVKGYYIVENNFYYFGEDGAMQKNIEVEGNRFGSDGKLVANNVFVTINNNTYYIVNNVIIKNYYIIENNIYYFGDDGVMREDTEEDGHCFDSDGKLIANNIFITINNNKYYVVNNVIVKGYYIIENNVYYFGDDGVMREDTEDDGHRFDSDGKLIANNIFITVNNNKYYVVNNVIVKGYYIVENNFYYFGEDGAMQKDIEVEGNHFGSDGKLIADNIFITINNNTYYIVNNIIIKNYYIIENNVYYFGDDGVMREDTEDDGHRFDSDGKLIANNIFITVNNNKYYVVNNVIVKGYYIIENNIYYFGDDGAMRKDTEDDGHRFDSDGKLVANNVFVTINNNTYYIVNNVIIKNYYIIENNIYYFGDDGAMRKDTEDDGHRFDSDGKLIADNIFITINNNTYYIVNNVIIKNYYIIENNIYYFGDDGAMRKDTEDDGHRFDSDGKLIADNIFITINNNTYYIVNNVIIKNYYIIENNIYYFGDDGVMREDTEDDGHRFDSDGKLIADNVFITINNNTYYIVNNVIIKNYYIIENNIYYFGDDGIMLRDGELDGYYFDENGKLSGNNIFITINEIIYYIVNGEAYQTENISGTITESDNDDIIENNEILEGVKCIAHTGAGDYEVYTNSDGAFGFGDIPTVGTSFTFEIDGYITVQIAYDGTNSLDIVMDKEVSNRLSGTIVIADADTNYSNNTPLSGARVTLRRLTGTNEFYSETTTDSNGRYLFDELTAGVYTLGVECEGYLPVNQTVNVRYNESNIQNLAIEAISNSQVNDGRASGYIIDAKTGRKIEGITVNIREGINNSRGEIICTVVSNNDGKYVTPELTPGNYTAEFVDERDIDDEEYRYGTVRIALKVLSDVTIENQNATMSNSAGITASGMQVVLTWGSTPNDLDSHLKTDVNNDGYWEYHVYYSDKDYYGANLDVDDTSSYGPETVTITQFEDGTYRYYVYNYSGGGSEVLSNSGACVKVYLDSSNVPAYTFYVPQGYGLYWHIFDYNYETGEFMVINEIVESMQ